MKILQICGSYSWGGLEMQTFSISEALSESGNEVVIICPQNSQFEKEKFKYGTCIYTINYKNNFFTVIQLFINALQIINPDIIHCQLSKDLHFVVPALKYLKYKTPLVFTKRMSSNINKKDFIHQHFYNRIDKIYAISEFVKSNMFTTTSVKPERIEVLYNGVNLERFNLKLYNKNEEKAKYSIDSNTIVIGITGRISPLKGHIEFIDAMAILKKLVSKNIKFIIVGGASFGEEDYYNQIKKYGIEKLGINNIIFTGYTNDIPKFLSIMDYFVFPSYEESLGNVVLEAMAMGIPVVASNSGAVPEIIKHNYTGILVNSKDDQAIALGVLDYLLNKGKVDIIRQNAISYIKENHNFDLYIDKLQNSYKLLINR